MPQNTERLGETRMMNCGMKATIIKYNNCKDIDIKFEDGYISKNREYKEFKKGGIQNKNLHHVWFDDLTGKRFGRLLVIKENKEKRKESKSNGIFWDCLCNCGNMTTVSASALKTNNTKSCGCLVRENKIQYRKHGSIEEERPDLLKYLVNENDKKYAIGSNKKIIVKCPKCNFEKEIIIGVLTKRGFSCPICSSNISYPNRFISSTLKEINIEFEVEKKFDWAKNKIYDFYIPSLSCIVEAMGKQHYENCTWSKAEEQQENDKLKEQLAKENGIKHYIILDCRESEMERIKNSILNSELNELFDFSNVDWQKCENNIKKHSNLFECCKMYDKGLNIEEIKNELNIKNNSTIITYLNKGKKMGICKTYITRKEETEKLKNLIIQLYKDGNNPYKIEKIINKKRTYSSIVKILKKEGLYGK